MGIQQALFGGVTITFAVGFVFWYLVENVYPLYSGNWPLVLAGALVFFVYVKIIAGRAISRMEGWGFFS